jgi:signal transduction histidine kinase
MNVNLDRYIGDKSTFSVEHRILNMVLIMGIFVAIAKCLVNYLLISETSLDIVSIISAIVLMSLYYLSIIKKHYSIIIYSLTLVLGFITIPVMWILNNGILGATPYYIIMYAVMIAVLLRGFSRIVTIVCFKVMILAFIIWDYSNIIRHADLYFGFSITLVALITFCVLILHYYIEEKKRAREYLLQIEKQNMKIQIARLDRLNLIGEMAASIAHEVRNPLTTVRGFLQLFQRKEEYAHHVEYLNIMIEELDRANCIIAEFLSLAKNRVINLKPCNLHQILNSIYPLIYASATPENKTILLDLNDVPDIIADENEIRQLILNLTRNAREAISKNGKIVISTHLDGGSVVLAVKDTGEGIAPEIYDRLGTPFLTTKENGVGLGLAICYQIAERHNAIIDAETSSVGTTFSIRFNAIEPVEEQANVLCSKQNSEATR